MPRLHVATLLVIGILPHTTKYGKCRKCPEPEARFVIIMCTRVEKEDFSSAIRQNSVHPIKKVGSFERGPFVKYCAPLFLDSETSVFSVPSARMMVAEP